TQTGHNQNVHSNIPSDSFMAGYCDMHFKPVAENECMEMQREEICEEFRHLPSDAQGVLDNIIGCMQADAGDGQSAANDPGCVAGDAQRLRLIKKYCNDESTSHALTFLPEEMMKAPEKCLQRGR